MKRVLCVLCALLLTPLAATAMEMSGDMGDMSGMSDAGGSVSYENKGTYVAAHSHSSTASLLPYDAVELTAQAEPMTALALGGQDLDVSLESGAVFTATLGAWDEEAGFASAETVNALRLNADTGQTWLLSGKALRTLRQSGIAYLLLSGGGQTLALPTSGFLSGFTYDQWRSAGIVDGELRYAITGATVRVTAGEETAEAAQSGGMLLFEGAILSADETRGMEQ